LLRLRRDLHTDDLIPAAGLPPSMPTAAETGTG
jgi:hypothetical protein